MKTERTCLDTQRCVCGGKEEVNLYGRITVKSIDVVTLDRINALESFFKGFGIFKIRATMCSCRLHVKIDRNAAN